MKNANLILCCATSLAIALNANAHDFSAMSDDNVEFFYEFADRDAKTVYVTFEGTNPYNKTVFYAGNVKVPSEVTYENQKYKVIGLAAYAFSDCVDLESIGIPGSVEAIKI